MELNLPATNSILSFFVELNLLISLGANSILPLSLSSELLLVSTSQTPKSYCLLSLLSQESPLQNSFIWRQPFGNAETGRYSSHKIIFFSHHLINFALSKPNLFVQKTTFSPLNKFALAIPNTMWQRISGTYILVSRIKSNSPVTLEPLVQWFANYQWFNL